ncbi:MAG: glutamine-hydrolyzing carbamoyl-phosphate synthase small subunit [bacterium]
MGTKGWLVLEDGSSFEGVSLGVPGERVGEVILNTAVVGYQELMTDPANAGKILVFTYPLIGNYGVAPRFNESKRCWVEGVIMKEESRISSNWQAEDTFDNFLKNEHCMALSDVDTRTLAVTVRDRGEMLGIVTSEDTGKADLLKKLREHRKKAGRGFIKALSVAEMTMIAGDSEGVHLGILDLGVTNSFIEQLKSLTCRITLLPYHTSSEAILGLNLDGLIISNGPEDDEAIPGVVEVVHRILDKIPLLGISTGHEVICLALGGKRTRMKLGHHGVNYPVKSPFSYKGEITVQNHSFAVDEESMKDRKDIAITLRHVDDHTIEEMESTSWGIISTQYYPVSPGFHEVHEVFRRFLRMIEMKKGGEGSAKTQ